jgi:tRNA(Ile2) C34 agmatinyltransferase TiaS
MTLICPICKRGELYPVLHSDGMKSWRCKYCGRLMSEWYWEEEEGRLVRRGKP